MIAFIPARKGSKGVPGKNLKEFKGKPLIFHTIEAAEQSGVFDEIVVSSDWDELLVIAGPYADRRPTELAQDDTTTDAVVAEFIERRQYSGLICLLQPTSPLRTAQHIREAVALGHPVISVCEVDNKALTVYAGNERISPLYPPMRRQELPRAYMPNGAIYIFSADNFDGIPRHNVIPYVMTEGLDIDRPEDFL